MQPCRVGRALPGRKWAVGGWWGRRKLPGTRGRAAPTHTPWSPFQSVSPSLSQRLGPGAGPPSRGSWTPARHVPYGPAAGAGCLQGRAVAPFLVPCWVGRGDIRASSQALALNWRFPHRLLIDCQSVPSALGGGGRSDLSRGLQPLPGIVRSSRQPCEGRWGN